MDIFISHAKEDKDAIARPLAKALIKKGYKIWYDEYTLKLGDSLRREIDRGLSVCKYGVVILSKYFFSKEWPQKELDSLATREIQNQRKIILPVWHGVDEKYIIQFSSLLADRIGISFSEGISKVVAAIESALDESILPQKGEKLVLSFRDWNFGKWLEVQRNLFPAVIPSSCSWTELDSIVKVLNKISAPNLNHMFFPTGGGIDLRGAKYSNEEGCIELDFGSIPRIIKPRVLYFESFVPYYNSSYFRLETYALSPSGIYEEYLNPREELIELEPLEYLDSSSWDDGEFYNKHTGEYEPLPGNARRVIRIFRGSFAIFAKGSLYNRISETYDGRHDKMPASEFRAYINLLIKEALKLSIEV